MCVRTATKCWESSGEAALELLKLAQKGQVPVGLWGHRHSSQHSQDCSTLSNSSSWPCVKPSGTQQPLLTQHLPGQHKHPQPKPSPEQQRSWDLTEPTLPVRHRHCTRDQIPGNRDKINGERG